MQPEEPSITRLFRGLKRPYDSALTGTDRTSNTDFTDCPFTALRYATGARGVVLVVDVAKGAARFSEELWLDRGAKRFMIWGAFEKCIVAEVLAKELRAQVRRRGVVTASDGMKASILRQYIADHLRDRGRTPLT